MVAVLYNGEELATNFVNESLVSADEEGPTKSFYATMPRPNIKTMSEMIRGVRIRSQNVTIPGEMMYLRLLAINAKKNVPLERVLSFENSAVPLSLFADDGSLLSGKKKSS